MINHISWTFLLNFYISSIIALLLLSHYSSKSTHLHMSNPLYSTKPLPWSQENTHSLSLRTSKELALTIPAPTTNPLTWTFNWTAIFNPGNISIISPMIFARNLPVLRRFVKWVYFGMVYVFCAGLFIPLMHLVYWVNCFCVLVYSVYSYNPRNVIIYSWRRKLVIISKQSLQLIGCQRQPH